MTFNNTLSTLITDTNNNIALLKGLQAQNQSETLSTADPFTDDPTVDATGLWTLAQTTFNTTDNLYIGVYKINGSFSCATIDIVSVSNYTVPADGIGAQYQVCGASTLTNVATPNALEGISANTIIVRSTTLFTVTLRLAAKWCYTFDFTQNNGNFAPVNSASNGVYDAQGWHPGFDFNFHIRQMVIRRTFSETTITSASIVYDAVAGDQRESNISWIRLYRGSSQIANVQRDPMLYGTAQTLILTTNALTDRLEIALVPGNGPGSGDPGGSASLKTLTVKGTGACPFGTPTCVA